MDRRRGCARRRSTATAAASCCSSARWRPLAAGVAASWRSRTSVSPSRPGWCTRSFVYSLLALGDLLHHVWRIEAAVRAATSPARAPRRERAGRPRHRSHGRRRLPPRRGREPQRKPDRRLRQPGVLVRARRPAGLVLFKVVSTMDSMVGYKTPRYLRFGWCGARLDDVMNYLPARLTWLVIAAVALVAARVLGGERRGASASGSTRCCWAELRLERGGHRRRLERRIVGPIWLKGVQVTDLWVAIPTTLRCRPTRTCQGNRADTWSWRYCGFDRSGGAAGGRKAPGVSGRGQPFISLPVSASPKRPSARRVYFSGLRSMTIRLNDPGSTGPRPRPFAGAGPNFAAATKTR